MASRYIRRAVHHQAANENPQDDNDKTQKAQ